MDLKWLDVYLTVILRQDTLDEVDKDKDGMISMQEYLSQLLISDRNEFDDIQI